MRFDLPKREGDEAEEGTLGRWEGEKEIKDIENRNVFFSILFSNIRLMENRNCCQKTGSIT